MRPFPEPPRPPQLSEEQRAVTSMRLRYNDVTQDGRLALAALPHGVGVAFWGIITPDHPVARAAGQQGVLPILSRMILLGGEGPVSYSDPVELRGNYQLAHTVDAAGAVDRLICNVWVDLHGVRGRTHGPPPEGAGEPVLAGRAFAEHVFTRPFAPPAERKVLRFDLPGLPPVPPDRHDWRPPEALLALPAGAEPLDPEVTPDEAPIAFGLDHTDANQHVNSLVYPALFQEAMLRRFAARGRPTALLCRRMEIAYRKPFFAGDRARVALQAFAHDGALGAVGAVGAVATISPEGGEGRPHAYAQALFTP